MSYYLIVRRYAPFETFGFGFEGDIRNSASTNPSASARTVGVVIFDTTSVQGFTGYSSGSTFEGAGVWVSKMIGRHYSDVKASISNEGRSINQISFTVHTEGSNPLVPIVAPDIDTFVDFNCDFGETGLKITGVVRGDSFPNAEIILLDDQLNPHLLFDFRTRGGRQTGPFGLFGDGASTLIGDFKAFIATRGGLFIAPNPAAGPSLMRNE